MLMPPYLEKRWIPSTTNPYGYVASPTAANPIKVTINGQPYHQSLDNNRGPVAYSQREYNCCPSNGWERKHSLYPRSAIAYPTDHSIPGPFLRSYMDLPRRSSMY